MKLFAALAAFAFLIPAVRAGELRAGAAAVSITPLPGTPLAGYYHTRVADGVLDNLYAKALVVEQDGAKAAFIVLDTTTVTRSITIAARKLIAEKTGIPPERVMISATHTHNGPVLKRDSLMDDITGASTPRAIEYGERLPGLIAQAVAEADAKLTPARASAGIGREDGLNFNRRYVMKDGTIGWNTLRSNRTNVVRPAGPIDPDVGVLYFESIAKSPVPLAAYTNFAMHPTSTGGTKISADYPGALARRFAEFKGPGFVSVFANGCCGNLSPSNIAWDGQQGGPREVDRQGTILAAAVFKTLQKLQPQATFAPRGRAKLVTLPRRTYTEQEVAAAKALTPKLADPKVGTVVKAEAVCKLDTKKWENVPLEVEVQAIALSDDVAIVSLPGEIFVELGLALKKASPFKHTFIAELANGSIGYIPNRSAYPEGNYEVVSARCAAGSGETLVDTAVALLKELRTVEKR